MKKFLCILLAFSMVFALSACTGGERGIGEAELLEGYDPNAAVTLKIGSPGGDTITPQEIIDNFDAAFPNITLEVDVAAWGEFQRKLKTQLAAKDPSHVFMNDSGYNASLGGKGAVMNLKGLIDRDINAEDYTAALFAATDAEGHVWGVPHAMNSIAILYNKKLFDEAGLAYPTEDWTFEEMNEMAKKLTKDENGDGEPEVYGYASSYNITEGYLPYVLASGGRLLDETRKISQFNTPEVLKGFERLYQPIEEGFSPTQQWISAQPGGTRILPFVKGQIAIILAQSSNIRAINENKADDFEYDAAPIPIGWDGNRYSVYVPNMWGIYSGATEQEKGAAWEFLKYYLSEEAQDITGKYCLSGYPIRKSTLSNIENNEEAVPRNVGAYFRYIDEFGETLFENPCWSEWNGVVAGYAAEIVRGEKVAAEIMPEVHEKVQEALDYYYNY